MTAGEIRALLSEFPDDAHVAMTLPVIQGERDRISDYLADISQEMDGEQDADRLRELWEHVRHIAGAIKIGLFAKPGPYMQLDFREEPPAGWERVGDWIRKIPEDGR